MLGGTVDGETMEVTDGPKFKVGDRDILFVENNGSQFIPLVGIMHGRFHVDKDEATGREIVTSNERLPIRDVSKLGHDETAASGTSAKAAASQAEALCPATSKIKFARLCKARRRHDSCCQSSSTLGGKSPHLSRLRSTECAFSRRQARFAARFGWW